MEEKDLKPLYFHMEKSENGNHSLTTKELIELLEKNKNQAIKAAREQRKKYILEVLKLNKIEITKEELEKILDGNIPEWLKKLSNEKNLIRPQQKNEIIEYIQLTSGLIIKIDFGNNTAYRFNNEKKEWNKDSTLFSEYEYGELNYKKISMNDNYPNGDDYHYGRCL